MVRGSGSDEIAAEAGYVVAPGDAEAPARAIIELAKHPEERARRSKLGLARAARYDRKEMARGYVRVWERLARGR